MFYDAVKSKLGHTLLSYMGAPVKLIGWAFSTKFERIVLGFVFVVGFAFASAATAAERISSTDAL